MGFKGCGSLRPPRDLTTYKTPVTDRVKENLLVSERICRELYWYSPSTLQYPRLESYLVSLEISNTWVRMSFPTCCAWWKVTLQCALGIWAPTLTEQKRLRGSSIICWSLLPDRNPAGNLGTFSFEELPYPTSQIEEVPTCQTCARISFPQWHH